MNDDQTYRTKSGEVLTDADVVDEADALSVSQPLTGVADAPVDIGDTVMVNEIVVVEGVPDRPE